MKFLTLKGREIKIQVRPSDYPLRSRENSKSNGQYHLGQQLQALFKHVIILEEFTIPDSRSSIDFYIPIYRLAFEFQGEQHDAYNSFFHNTKADFERQKERDRNKKEWCDLNNIKLIEIRDNKISLEALKVAIKQNHE